MLESTISDAGSTEINLSDNAQLGDGLKPRVRHPSPGSGCALNPVPTDVKKLEIAELAKQVERPIGD
jgi:hypothetical protein